MRKLGKALYYILILLLITVIGLLVISIFPITGNIEFLVVQSGSMEPTIKVGSMTMIKPIDQYSIGDIITFNIDGRAKVPTTHRIFDVEFDQGVPSFITKGDANEDPDVRLIVQDDILGKVIFTLPFIGYAVDFAKKPIGFITIIVVPALAIILDEVRKIFVEMKKIKKDKQLPKNQDNKEDDDKKDL